jgi:hypothetical protein
VSQKAVGQPLFGECDWFAVSFQPGGEVRHLESVKIIACRSTMDTPFRLICPYLPLY